jgi:hypothetical protein
LDLLTEAKVEFPKNRRFFEVAKALLREPRFDGLLAEAKADEKEGRKARKNSTARLIQVVMDLPHVQADCFAWKTPVAVPARTFLSQLI